MMTPHPEQTLIDRLYQQGLDAAQWDRLFPHLRECQACREHYEKVQAEHRSTTGEIDDVLLTAHESAAVLRVLQERAQTQRRKVPFAQWFGGLSLAAATVCAVLLVLRPYLSAPRPQPEIRTMGAPWDPASSVGTLCVPKDGASIVVTARPVRCRAAETLALNVIAPPVAIARFVTLVAVTPAFSVARIDTQRFDSDKVVLVGPSVGPNDSYRVFVLWSRQAPDGDSIRAAVKDMQALGKSVDQSGELPVSGAKAQITVSLKTAVN